MIIKIVAALLFDSVYIIQSQSLKILNPNTFLKYLTLDYQKTTLPFKVIWIYVNNNNFIWRDQCKNELKSIYICDPNNVSIIRTLNLI